MTSRRLRRVALIAGTAAAATVAVVVTAGAVNSHDVSASPPSANSPLFDGLPTVVVAEVLANPEAQANVAIWPAEETAGRNALWQGMVINFTQCRQMLSIYQDWTSTGRPSSLPPLVLPSNTSVDVVDSAKLVDSSYRKVLAAGDASELASLLQNESGCGVWIPATPGDTDGPVIADVVAASEASI